MRLLSTVCFISFSYCAAGNAVQFSGMTIDEKVIVDKAFEPLVLNGVGKRSTFFTDIYVAALYLPKRANSVEEIIRMPGPKRVAMRFLDDEIEKEVLIEGWNQGFENNQGTELMPVFRKRLHRFNSFFKTVRKGNYIYLDYVPNKGTTIIINGIEQATIYGGDFYRAVLEVWLGNDPVDSDLKRALTGSN